MRSKRTTGQVRVAQRSIESLLRFPANWLAQTFRLVRREDSGLLTTDKQRRLLSVRRNIWRTSIDSTKRGNAGKHATPLHTACYLLAIGAILWVIQYDETPAIAVPPNESENYPSIGSFPSSTVTDRSTLSYQFFKFYTFNPRSHCRKKQGKDVLAYFDDPLIIPPCDRAEPTTLKTRQVREMEQNPYFWSPRPLSQSKSGLSSGAISTKKTVRLLRSDNMETAAIGIIEASRLFAGPSQFPPEDFAAYGILAFRSLATTQDRKRYLMLCEAYTATLLHTSWVSLPKSQQMVTVWPIDSDRVADHLNEAPRLTVCGTAVDRYGLRVAIQALNDASQAGANISDKGPYLLAWSPSINKGKHDALVLVVNLSEVTTSEQAKSRLLRWRVDILRDPSKWNPRWDVDALIAIIREWVDKYGTRILMLVGSQK